jgi:hypothetical protein
MTTDHEVLEPHLIRLSPTGMASGPNGNTVIAR